MKNKVQLIELKREKEKEIVRLMILKYCEGNKHGAIPCERCTELISYVEKRIDYCPFMETKTYCANCEVHCYKPSMRREIQEVMRYSGPRMIFSHPLATLDHVYQGIKHKFKKKPFLSQIRQKTREN